MFRSATALFLAGVVLTAHRGWAETNETPVPPPVGSAAFRRYVADGRDSPFGLDYVFVLDRTFREPSLARQLGGFVGGRWVNFARVSWGEIEPRAPRGGTHEYRWTALDEGVRQWQQYGVQIMMSLRFVTPWANATPSTKPLCLDGLLSWIPRHLSDYLPKPEHQQDLRDFIQRLEETDERLGLGLAGAAGAVPAGRRRLQEHDVPSALARRLHI